MLKPKTRSQTAAKGAPAQQDKCRKTSHAFQKKLHLTNESILYIIKAAK